MIYKYNSFLEDKLFENIINESVIYYSPNFRLYVNMIGGDISKDLLSKEKQDVKPDMTFIDLSDKNGFISFSQMGKAISILKKELHGRYRDQSVVDRYLQKIIDGNTDSNFDDICGLVPDLKSKSRNDIKIGKLINSIFPGKYSKSEVEDFVNKFKSISSGNLNFKLVEGNDIIKYYDFNNYKYVTGTLGNSCMRYSKCNNYFNIYVKNPDVCKLLILKTNEDDDTILGRALIWKISNIDIDADGKSPEYYMDRIYTSEDFLKESFIKYANENEWMIRTKSGYSDCMDFTFKGQEYEEVAVTVKLKEWKFDKYPYMDTFKSLDVYNGVLYNMEETSEEGYYILTNTDGSYDDTSGYWSDYEDRRISQENAVYSDPLQDYLDIERSVEITIGSRRHLGWYPQSYDDISLDPFRNDYMHDDDAVYSEYYGQSFFSEDVADTIIEVNSADINNFNFTTDDLSVRDNNVIEITKSEFDSYEYLNDYINESYVHISLLKKNTNNKYYFRDFSVLVYKTNNGDYIKNDCDILNIEYTIHKSYYTDYITYYYSILDDDKKNNLKLKYEHTINEIGNVISGKQSRFKFDDDDSYINNLASKLSEYTVILNKLNSWI